MIQRARFSQDLESLRARLGDLLPVLESHSNWYGSIYFERKRSKRFSVDTRKSDFSEDSSSGVVFRIYDGQTLFEEATDALSPLALEAAVQRLVGRVKRQPQASGMDRRPYRPPAWKERLSNRLDGEILSQIPSAVTATTHVHFGTRFRKDPGAVSVAETFDQMKQLLAHTRKMALSEGLSSEDLSYVRIAHRFSTEDAIFIDRESNLSQTLLRISGLLLLMSGADRTHLQIGGLGGLEVAEFSDRDVWSLIQDLLALKKAQRLVPGKYRVLFSPEVSGVLAHEAFGHSQEGDTCARGRSRAWNLYQTGERVGNDHATILNNPALFENGSSDFGAWGSYFFDEEGWLATEHTLLDRGRLQSPMTHLLAAIRLGVPRTANGKRENFSHGVYARQTNTYFSAGKKTFSELLEQIESGFLAEHCAGGMEDPKGMGIQVGIAYLKEVTNGKLTGRIFKGPAGGDIQMTGYTPDILNSILDKSKIEADHPGPDHAKHPKNDVGGCGKYHKEYVVAGCGGPYLLIDQVTLG